MASSQVAKPRARRASRAPLAKSLSVDESVLSGAATLSSATTAFGRPSSMLARASSSSGAVINPANAQAHPTKTLRLGTVSQAKVGSHDAGTGKPGQQQTGGPRRVLGDLSNANKLVDARPAGGKDGLVKDGKPGLVTRVRSSTGSSFSTKPLAARPSSQASLNPVSSTNQVPSHTSQHSRTASAASRNSFLSHKSSQSSLADANAVNATAVQGHRRIRTASDNYSTTSSALPAPSAPRIGTGSFHSRSSTLEEARLHSHQPVQHDDEILDTVQEGDSYSASVEGRHGLGIDWKQAETVADDEMQGDEYNDRQNQPEGILNDIILPAVAPSHDHLSIDTFELDLDGAFDDSTQAEAPRARAAHPSSMHNDNARPSKMAKNSHKQDVNDWLSLTHSAEKLAKAKIQEIVEVFEDKPEYGDISMVAEYADEIFSYMEDLEIESMPNPNYIDSQTEIEWPMRATLIDWLLQVHMRYHMLPETLWITINIVDRFLSNRIVSLVKLQLVGITAMFVAAKYEEIMAPSVDEFVYMTESNYSREEILKGERIILASLDFKVSNYCSPYSWVRRISKADDYDIQTRTLSKFLMEVTLLDHRFLRVKPSMIAAVGMYLARRMLGGDWNESFVFYSRYTESQLAQPTSYVLSAIAADSFEERFVYQKYSGKKYLKASIFARQWAKTTLESATRAHELSMK